MSWRRCFTLWSSGWHRTVQTGLETFRQTYSLHLQSTPHSTTKLYSYQSYFTRGCSQVHIWYTISAIQTLSVSFLSPAPNYTKTYHGCFLSNPSQFTNFPSNSPYSISATMQLKNKRWISKDRESMFLAKPVTTSDYTPSYLWTLNVKGNIQILPFLHGKSCRSPTDFPTYITLPILSVMCPLVFLLSLVALPSNKLLSNLYKAPYSLSSRESLWT